MSPTWDATVIFSPTDPLSFVVTVTNEAVLDREPGQDRVFGDAGAYVAELYGEAEVGPAVVAAGKFDPEFGLATTVLDGFAATDIVGNYDNDERWATQVMIAFEAFGLSQAFTVSAFTTDRTILSESLFTNRGRVTLSDGGAGNVSGIGSLAAVYDGCLGADTGDCPGDGQFGYRLGLRYQRHGQATAEQIEDEIKLHDEAAFLGATTAGFELGDETALRLLGEVAYVRNLDGEPDDAVIATGAAALDWQALTFEATYSRQHNLIAGEPNTVDQLIDLTATFQLDEEITLLGEAWSLAAGYSWARNGGGETAHLISMSVSFGLEWNSNPPAADPGAE